MRYRIFDTDIECAEANGLWLLARMESPEFDRCLGVVVGPQITSAWDYGKVMNDGRIACQVPTMWADEFGGLELNLESGAFPKVVNEV